MRFRVVAPAAAVLAAAAVIAAPASAGPATGQVNVVETASTCHLKVSSVASSAPLILFHIVDNSPIPRGIIVWGVHSTMALPGGEANLFVKFRGPGNYAYACTAGSYRHPTIAGRGVLRISPTGILRLLPAG
jgi:hypothetical protein